MDKILSYIRSEMKLKVIDLADLTQDDWRTGISYSNLIDTYKSYYEVIGFNLPWVGYFIIKENKLVGCCSFTGAPKNGRAEIAYWTFKEYEGQGIASFACKELVSICRQENSVIQPTAKTAPEHNASTHILQRNNFTFSAIVNDDEIGDAWLWLHEEKPSKKE